MAVLLLKGKALARRTQRLRRGRRRPQAINQSADTVAHVRHVKVQQITKLETAEAKIAKQLTTVYRQDVIDRFEFDHDPILDEQVDAIAIVDQ